MCLFLYAHSFHLAGCVTWQYPLGRKAGFRTPVQEFFLYILECVWPDTVYLII